MLLRGHPAATFAPFLGSAPGGRPGPCVAGSGKVAEPQPAGAAGADSTGHRREGPSSWPTGAGRGPGHQRRSPSASGAGGGRLPLGPGHRHLLGHVAIHRCRSPAGLGSTPGAAHPRSPLLPPPPGGGGSGGRRRRRWPPPRWDHGGAGGQPLFGNAARGSGRGAPPCPGHPGCPRETRRTRLTEGGLAPLRPTGVDLDSPSREEPTQAHLRGGFERTDRAPGWILPTRTCRLRAGKASPRPRSAAPTSSLPRPLPPAVLLQGGSKVPSKCRSYGL